MIEKSRLASLRISQPSKKRFINFDLTNFCRKGRLDMTKSAPLENKREVEEVSSDNKDEEDAKYFRPYLNDY